MICEICHLPEVEFRCTRCGKSICIYCVQHAGPGKYVLCTKCYDTSTAYWSRWTKWENSVRDAFKKKYPELAKLRFDVCGDGTVCVYTGAYPFYVDMDMPWIRWIRYNAPC